MVTIHVAGFQTVAIFMQTGDDPEKSVAAAESVSNVVQDSHHKVCISLFSDSITLFFF